MGTATTCTDYMCTSTLTSATAAPRSQGIGIRSVHLMALRQTPLYSVIRETGATCLKATAPSYTRSQITTLPCTEIQTSSGMGWCCTSTSTTWDWAITRTACSTATPGPATAAASLATQTTGTGTRRTTELHNKCMQH